MTKKSKISIIMVLTLAILSFAWGQAFAAKPFEGQKLTVIYMSSVYADAALDMVPLFEEKTGATVEVLSAPYVTLYEKLSLDLTNQIGAYDVISVACQWDGGFAPYLEPLEPYIERDNYDLSDFIDNVFNNSGIWQGTIYGIPHANTAYMMAYRTDLVEEPPQTWDEYLEIAAKYTNPEEGMYGISIPGQKEQYAGLFYIRLWSMGGSWADEDWNITINSEEGRAAMEHVGEVMKYCDPAALSWGLEESIDAFLRGNAVFCEAWPTLGITQRGDDPAESNIVGKWALAPFPREKTGANLLSSWNLAIPKTSKNKDLAWEWIKMYNSPEMHNLFFDRYQILSPRESFWDRDDVKNSKSAPMRKELERSLIWWRIPAATEAERELGNAVSSYMAGEMTLDEAMKYAQQALERTIRMMHPGDVKNDKPIYLKEWAETLDEWLAEN